MAANFPNPIFGFCTATTDRAPGGGVGARGGSDSPADLAGQVLSADEIVRFLEAVPGLCNQAALTTAYGEGPCGQLTRIDAPGDVGAIRRRGDRQNTADRLDPVHSAVLVNEGDHGLNRRSSSAWAK